MPKLRVSEFADKVRERKPEYSHLDDSDIIQMVTQKSPNLIGAVDRQDLIKVVKESRAKQLSKARQKEFSSLSGVDRFGAGMGQGMLDVYQGIKQMFGGDTQEYQGDKAAYMDASEGDITAGIGEIAGGIAATAPIPGFTGIKLAGKVGAPLAKTAIKGATALGVGAGFGASEFVDEDETRLKNTAFGTLFGGAGYGAGKLVSKLGAKGVNALKGRYQNANVQELMDLSKKYDIPLSTGDITGKGKSTEKALEGIPVVGMGGFRKKGAEKTSKAIEKKAGSISDDWDEAIQSSLESKARQGKAQAKKNYDKVDELSEGMTIKPKASIETATKIEKELLESVVPDDAGIFTKIKANLEKGEMSFGQLRKARSDLGAEAKKLSMSDPNKARLVGQLKKSVEGDLAEFGKGSKGKTLYHGTNEAFEEFDLDKTPLGDIWFTDNKGSITKGLSGASGTKNIMERNIDIPDNKLAGWDEYDKLSLGELIRDGYKGVKLPQGDRTDYIVFDPKDIKMPKKGKKELTSAFKKATKSYKENVVPFKDKKIINALKSDTPDEIFDTFIKKGKGDKAKNFYNLLDNKGKSALRDGFLENAIVKQDGSYNSPAKIAGYLERMAKPKGSIFQGKDLKEINDFAKIMRHAERYGQLNESPSNGMQLIPYLKTGALLGVGAGGATAPIATAFGVAAGSGLTAIMSLMKTSGKKFTLASSEIGSKAFEQKLNKILAQLPKISAVTGKELTE